MSIKIKETTINSVNNKANRHTIIIIGDKTEINTEITLEIGEYKTVEPIPYSVLEQGIKDLISNWNQKQKEN